MRAGRLCERMSRGCRWLAVAALAAAALALPVAASDHCETKISVHGRVALVPMGPSPYASSTHGVCVRVFGDNGFEDHLLPPNTDEVMVRVNGDFGASVPSLRATLTGLGFTGNEYPLARTLSPFGGYTYNSAWQALPNGPVDGALVAAVTYPDRQVSVTYHTTATVIVPPLPP